MGERRSAEGKRRFRGGAFKNRVQIFSPAATTATTATTAAAANATTRFRIGLKKTS